MSQNQPEIPFHSTVKAILDDLVAREGGPVLPEERLRHWIRAVSAHEHHHEIATQLIVLAQRFLDKRSGPTAEDFVIIAAAAIGSSYAYAELTKQGVTEHATKALMTRLAERAPTLQAGLPSPAAGGAGIRPGGSRRKK